MSFSSHRSAKEFVCGLAAIFRLRLLASVVVLPASAQTVWTLDPDAPASLDNSSFAKLKFIHNAFRLVWGQSSYPYLNFHTELNDVTRLAVPYSLQVTSQSMGVTLSSSSRKLTIRYVTSGGEYQAVVPEGGYLIIPSSAHTLVGPAQPVSGAVVLSAMFGTTSSPVDVKSAFRTTSLTYSYSAMDLTGGDFTVDEAGKLLLLGGTSSEVRSRADWVIGARRRSNAGLPSTMRTERSPGPSGPACRWMEIRAGSCG